MKLQRGYAEKVKMCSLWDFSSHSGAKEEKAYIQLSVWVWTMISSNSHFPVWEPQVQGRAVKDTESVQWRTFCMYVSKPACLRVTMEVLMFPVMVLP